VKIEYKLSKEAQKKRFIETADKSERIKVEFNPADLTKGQRKILTEAHLPNWNELGIYYVDYEHYRAPSLEHVEAEYDHELSIEDIFKEITKQTRSYEKKNTEYLEARKAYDAECEKERKAEEKRKAEKKAQRKAEIEKELKECETWIAEHGSDYLKRACGAGHDCTRGYLTERAAKEYPDAILDFNDHADWRTRSCPSVKALDLRDEILKEHSDAEVEIVWLTAEPLNETGLSKEDLYDRDQEFTSHEAVKVLDPNFGEDNLLFYGIAD